MSSIIICKVSLKPYIKIKTLNGDINLIKIDTKSTKRLKLI